MAGRHGDVLGLSLGGPALGAQVRSLFPRLACEGPGCRYWAASFGAWGIFISRLLPVVRHLIGIPAGVVRMNYRVFSIYTLLGSALWCAVLCWVGVMAGKDQRLMEGELHRLTLWLVGTLAVLGIIYYRFVHRYMKPAPSSVAVPKPEA